MKKSSPFRAAALAVATAALVQGCATQKQVSATYLVPARALADVRSVDVIEIVPEVRLSGNQAAPGDDARLAVFVRQTLSANLYRGGYFRTSDPFLDSSDGAVAIGGLLTRNESRHGYSTLIAASDPAKASLEITLDLRCNVDKTTCRQTFELKTVPYIVKTPGDGKGLGSGLESSSGSLPGGDKLAKLAGAVKAVENLVPYSIPDPAATTTERVESSWDVWETEVAGTMHVRLVPAGTSDPVYERDFALSAPFAAGSSAPTFLLAAASAVSPALGEIVMDISPTSEKRPLVLNSGGDDRAVMLLEAGAWTEAMEEIEKLPPDEVSLADWENLGVAREILGDFRGASEAYEKALAIDPENEPLQAKMLALAKASKARKDVRASGAKESDDTSFKSGRLQ